MTFELCNESQFLKVSYLNWNLYTVVLKGTYHRVKKVQGVPGLYKDRVKNKKNNFEIPAFLKFEWGTLRAGKFKSLYSLYIIDFY